MKATFGWKWLIISLSILSNIIISSSNNTPSIEDTSSNIYTVKRGDSLYSIANQYDLTVNELTEKNHVFRIQVPYVGFKTTEDDPLYDKYNVNSSYYRCCTPIEISDDGKYVVTTFRIITPEETNTNKKPIFFEKS